MAFVLLIAFLGSIISAAGLTWTIRNIALQHGWVRGSRSAQHLSMPRLGGVAIATVVAVMSCAVLFSIQSFHYFSQSSIHQMLLVLSAALISFAVGLVDDFLDISAWTKISAEVIAGLLLWSGGIRILHLTSLYHSHQFGATVSALLTVFWVLFISNAFNLIDGLDGLAAGSALFSVLTVFVVSLITQNLMPSLLAAILAGAILGFLRYNFNPATIYLGDCGSLFIGTLLAGLTLTGATQQKSSTLIAVAIPLVAFGLPVVETSVSVIRRFLSGQPIFVADRQHIHHRLLARGWSHRQVVVILYAVSALFGLLSLALLTPGQASLAIVLLVLGIGVVTGVQKVGYHEFVEIGRVARRAFEQKQIIINNLSVRRGAERLAGCTEWHEIVAVLQEIFADNDFDHFQLTVKAAATNAPVWNYQWQRPVQRSTNSSTNDDTEANSEWSLSLQLRVLHGKWNGSLDLSRIDSSALLLDINLLTSELRVELERACHKAAANGRNSERQESLRRLQPKALSSTAG